MFNLKKWVTVLCPLTLLAAPVYADTNSTRMRLPSSGLSLVQQATLIGAVKPNTTMTFTVWLKLRNKAQLDQAVRDMYDPSSSNYQRFLTSSDFNQHYAPSPDAEKTVQDYFTALGMHAKIVNHSVRITATAGQVEQALQVKINRYQYQNRTVYANATAPTLSRDVGQYVAEISGLSDIVRFHPHFSRPINSAKQNKVQKPHAFNLAWDSFIPSAQPTTTSLVGFTGAHLQTTYNIATIAPINATTIDGAGQTLVIIDACGRNDTTQITADANLYNTANGITPLSLSGLSKNFAVINSDVDGTPYTTCGTSGATGWETEIALDVEASHTIATGANTVLVLAPTSSQNDMQCAIANVVNNLTTNNFVIAKFHNAYVVSNSWGTSENELVSPFMEATLEMAAAQGISFNFSTGDCGDETYTSSKCVHDDSPQPSPPAPPPPLEPISVNYPASSAFVTAVGGTSLFVDHNWNYAFETGWGTYIVSPDDNDLDNGFVFGGGGGISQYYGPVAWQRSISNYTAGGYNAGTVGQYNKRALPDIAMMGDPYTGLLIYVNGAPLCPAVGGTSLACPLFAGTLTLINQARTLLGKSKPIGLAACHLYTANSILMNAQALNRISPPHQIINGASRPPAGAPLSAFTLSGVTFNWDSSLTLTPDNQFWNDVVGVGSPNIPYFVTTMANL